MGFRMGGDVGDFKRRRRLAAGDAESDTIRELEPIAVGNAVGDAAEIFALGLPLGKALDGKHGVTTEWRPEKGRFEIQLNDGYPVNLTSDNRRKLVEPGSEDASSRAAAPEHLTASDAESERDSELVPLSGSSINAESETDEELAPLAVGDAVEICGLKSEEGKKLNGQRGKIGARLSEKGRYESQMPVGDAINRWPGNLQKVEQEAAASSEGATPAFTLTDAESESDSEL
eukprot:14400148-Heterocapsa_arctica.AAC.1